MGQTFRTSADTYYIGSVRIDVDTTAAFGTGTASIRATSGGLPTGADIASITGTWNLATNNDITVTFSSPVPVSPSTTYAVILRSDSGSNAQLEASDASFYANGSVVTSANGTTWSANGSKDLDITVNEARIASGQIGKALDDGTTRETGFIGFAESAISRGESGTVIIGGYVSGLSGVSTGSVIALSNTPGAVGTGQTKKIGIGVSSTGLVIATTL